MNSITLFRSESNGLTGSLRRSVSRETAAGTSLPANVFPLVRTFAVTALSQSHNDFDALIAELEAEPESARELAEAGAWVAETFYAEEGDTIRTCRMRKGLSQAQLGKLLNTSQPQVAKIESGRVDLQHSTIIRLMDVLGVDANAMFEMIKNQPKPQRGATE
ncbi:helix-turn-helix domain-containing protein [Enterobacterales bacterium AE_CKDN230030158-1A_HGKHYDSX7]